MGSSAGREGGVVIDDVDVRDAWERLKADTTSALVDVRTRAEWSYVGIPDLSSIGKKPVLVEWQTFPTGQVDAQFAEKLAGQLVAAGVKTTADIFFICRSGGRSKAAATLMAAKGYSRCHNVADGFEGPLDQRRHRGKAGGWKAAELPWIQT
jgi:rhodanese-related sulfurtransferase